MSVALEVEALTSEAFRPFGDVIMTEGADERVINQGTTTRFHDLANIDVGNEDGAPLISIFRAVARPRPLQIAMLERHPLGSQAFFPLSHEDWIVVVAEGGDRPELATLRCFRARGDQGVNYRACIWHHPLVVLAPCQDFIVVDRGGKGDNLEECPFSPADVRTIDV